MIAAIGTNGSVNALYPQYQVNPVTGVNRVNQTDKVEGKDQNPLTGKVKPSECQTCKNRKYQDGSDEGNVSFKSPGHISPAASYGKVMAHEQEHVANAISEGNQENKELVSVSVSLHMAVCPECGTSYVSGGTTNTTMATYSENPYDQSRKAIEGSYLKGQNVDACA